MSEKCCGNCEYFDDENIYGCGICILNGLEMYCDLICDGWKQIEESEDEEWIKSSWQAKF